MSMFSGTLMAYEKLAASSADRMRNKRFGCMKRSLFDVVM